MGAFYFLYVPEKLILEGEKTPNTFPKLTKEFQKKKFGPRLGTDWLGVQKHPLNFALKTFLSPHFSCQFTSCKGLMLIKNKTITSLLSKTQLQLFWDNIIKFFSFLLPFFEGQNDPTKCVTPPPMTLPSVAVTFWPPKLSPNLTLRFSHLKIKKFLKVLCDHVTLGISTRELFLLL